MFNRYKDKPQFVSVQGREPSRPATEDVQLVPHRRRRSRIVTPFRRSFASVKFSTVR